MDEIAALTARGRERLVRLGLSDLELGSAGALARALGYSDYLHGVLTRTDRETAAAVLQEAKQPIKRSDIARVLDVAPTLAIGTQQVLVLIALRELTGLMTVRASLLAASVLAEAVLVRALAEESESLGGFVVFALGKLGGRELNFYSDLDLVLGRVATDDEHGEQEWDRRARRFLARLEGGFRIDLRLRPFGQSGPLAMSLSAMEAYFQNHGREWERYAWVKARPVAGARGAGREFLRRLRPFVYRRYLDYHAIDALREMKRQIAEAAGASAQDIKRGPGGIREIEFVIQAFQLVRGGRTSALAGPSLAAALAAVVRLELLSRSEGETLAAAYYFLRRVENRLQVENLSPSHHLPEDGERCARLAASLGYQDWSGFVGELSGHQTRVQQIFEGIFGAPVTGSARGPLVRLWSTAREPAACELAAEAGFRNPEAVTEALAFFKASRAVRLMSARGRLALDRVMPELLREAAMFPDSEQVLVRLLRLLGAFVRRSAYLALLVERPAARRRLIEVVGASDWIARRLAATPAALDELLDARLTAAVGRQRLVREMAAIARFDDADLASERLREINETQRLKLAVALLDASLAPEEIELSLSLLAELSFRASLGFAARSMRKRHGALSFELLALGYGKLGSCELGFGSDLDLVFVYRMKAAAAADGLAAETYLARLAQRTITLLSQPTAAGSLYSVDTRLRPEGTAGLLLSSYAAWCRYQREAARPWERQALLRARPVAGSPALARSFHGERSRQLTQPVEAQDLASEIVSMRARVAALGPRRGESGAALLDGEFLAAYWLLAGAARCPSALRSTRLAVQLAELSRCAGMPQAGTLATALGELRAALSQRVLGLAGGDEIEARARERIAELWRAEFGDTSV
ncbi:MAG: bifunctional [glutamate--ammonia ligase]-adenylyl-L-tyrosine phosphorylase/[glutamate--ammonia-ligase] adenylyltransferase [Gammaproteobacteria bacterium]